MSADSATDIAKANEMTTNFRTKQSAGFEDYTWHHLHDGKTMILVPTDLHNFVKHNGGDSITRAIILSHFKISIYNISNWLSIITGK